MCVFAMASARAPAHERVGVRRVLALEPGVTRAKAALCAN